MKMKKAVAGVLAALTLCTASVSMAVPASAATGGEWNGVSVTVSESAESIIRRAGYAFRIRNIVKASDRTTVGIGIQTALPMNQLAQVYMPDSGNYVMGLQVVYEKNGSFYTPIDSGGWNPNPQYKIGFIPLDSAATMKKVYIPKNSVETYNGSSSNSSYCFYLLPAVYNKNTHTTIIGDDICDWSALGNFANAYLAMSDVYTIGYSTFQNL